MADYVSIRTSAISEVTEVRLYEETVAKVVRNHREIPAGLPMIDRAVIRAIANPTRVFGSRAGSFVYVDDGVTNGRGDPLKVPVKLVSGTQARVATFFFARVTPAEDRNTLYKRGGGDA